MEKILLGLSIWFGISLCLGLIIGPLGKDN
jgi:hypothetical protein